MDKMGADDILDFWFGEQNRGKWWQKDPDFDQEIRLRFSTLHRSACRCELYLWRQSPQGRLAEILVLDQFSRNMFRDSPKAFSQDGQALVLAQEAVAAGDDQELEAEQRGFLYMPYMHSESVAIHEEALRLFTSLGNADKRNYEERHREIILRFGRYPHRNSVLNRQSTPEEEAFLRQPGSSF
jgi:uncharacterized protein (DUF924 family)